MDWRFFFRHELGGKFAQIRVIRGENLISDKSIIHYFHGRKE